MRVKNFSSVISQLEVHLEDYLDDHGIDSSKLFSCIHPDHDDGNPSCGIVPSNRSLFHCLGCGCSGDIFKAAHFLEGKPLVGIGFVTENLQYLADRFGVSIETTPMTEFELYELDTYRAYKLASDYICTSIGSGTFLAAVADREWKSDTYKAYGVGSIQDFKQFRETMKKYGFSANFLDDVDLGRKDIFDDNKIIFTIKDEFGRPVGFAARNLSHEENGGSKYVNQKHTGAKCNIYKKGTRLFGIDRAIINSSKRNREVYIFEGYSDVVTAAQHGVTNCVAVGGTALTVEQVNLLKRNDFYKIILCFDGDNAGQSQTARVLDDILGGHKDLDISIVAMPEGTDPDQLIRDKGPGVFLALPQQSAFEWRLSRFSSETSAEEICESMIPLIVNESSAVKRESLIKALTLHTGVSKEAIKSDVKRVQNSKEAEKERKRRSMLEGLSRSLIKEPDSAEYYIASVQTELRQLAASYNEDLLSEDQFVSFLKAQKEEEEKGGPNVGGFKLGSDLKIIQDALEGNWKSGIWITLGGKENVGKSTLAVEIAFNIANIEENNACVIIHSIDDAKTHILPKLVALAAGSKALQLNHITNPNYHADQLGDSLFTYRDLGYSIIENLAKQGRLIVKDSSDGKTLSYGRQLVSYYKEKFPDRKIVYLLDNFHKLHEAHKSNKDSRATWKDLSTQTKDLAVEEDILVISTVEYPKLKKGEKPNNDNIGETAQIKYDANVIFHLYSDLHEHLDESEIFHVHEVNGEPKKLPRVELIVGKNKVSSFKGSLWLDFYPEHSQFEGVDASKIEFERKENLEKTSAEQSEQLAFFAQAWEEVMSKGQKPGRAGHIFKDKFGFYPDNLVKQYVEKYKYDGR